MVKRLALDRQLDTVPEATKPGWSHRNLLAGTQLRVKQAVHSDPCDFSEQEGFLLGTRQPPPKKPSVQMRSVFTCFYTKWIEGWKWLGMGGGTYEEVRTS